MACEYGSWTAPAPVNRAAAAREAVARFPTVAVGRERAYVVGVDLPYFGGRRVRENPLTAWEVGGESVGRPTGRFTFAMPAAAVDRHGRLHVVWGEPAGGPPDVEASGWPGEPPSSVWAAHFERGRGWSAPERLYEGTRLSWEGTLFERRSRAASGALHLAAPMFSAAPHAGIMLFRHDGSRWVVATVPGRAQYASVASADARVFLGYIGSSFVGQQPWDQGQHGIFLWRSDDEGATWSTLRQIVPLRLSSAFDLQLLAGPDTALHLVWRQVQAPLRGGIPDSGVVLRHAVSRDAGETWSPYSDTPLLTGFARPHAVVDPCGRVHVLYEHWRALGHAGHLDHIVWDGRWSKPAHLFTSLRANSIDLAMADDGRLVLAFLAQPAAAPRDAPITSVFSELRLK